MKIAFAVLLVVHGLIHTMGALKGFGLAELPQLVQPISRAAATLWALAALGLLVTAVLLFVAPSSWWIAALPAVIASQVAVVTSWSDAKYGTVANLVILVPLAIVLLDFRPSSFRSVHAREVASSLAAARGTPARIVTEADIAPLPAPVQKYLRRVGAVGRPRVRDFEATFVGVMHADANKKDASFSIGAHQHSFFADQRTRLFLIGGERFGLPFDALHMYRGASATMQVRIASLFTIVDARGPKMDQSETVTMLNDMCILAPSTLIDAGIEWTLIDDRHVGAKLTNAGHTVSATLTFDGSGDLVGFVSNDRYQSGDGKTYLNYPWSTPVSDYRVFDGRRVAAKGDAIWQEPSGPFVYASFELVALRYDVSAERGVTPHAPTSSLSLAR